MSFMFYPRVGTTHKLVGRGRNKIIWGPPTRGRLLLVTTQGIQGHGVTTYHLGVRFFCSFVHFTTHPTFTCGQPYARTIWTYHHNVFHGPRGTRGSIYATFLHGRDGTIFGHDNKVFIIYPTTTGVCVPTQNKLYTRGHFRGLHSTKTIRPHGTRCFTLPYVGQGVTRTTILTQGVLRTRRFAAQLIGLKEVTIYRLPTGRGPSCFKGTRFLYLPQNGHFTIPRCNSFVKGPRGLLRFIQSMCCSTTLLFRQVCGFGGTLHLQLNGQKNKFIGRGGAHTREGHLYGFGRLPL